MLSKYDYKICNRCNWFGEIKANYCIICGNKLNN